MDTKQYYRRPFDVNVVEVTPENVHDIAEWCGGTVGKAEYRHAKYKVMLDVVKVPNNAPNAIKPVDARFGYFVVEHNGSFRVYRPKQFADQFAAYVEKPAFFKEGDKVRDTDPDAAKNMGEGLVLREDAVLVKFPLQGNMLFRREELEHIEVFSDETLEKFKLDDEQAIGVDKINAMRAAAEEAVGDGQVFPPDAVLAKAVTEVNGMEVGTPVGVCFEHSVYFGDEGVVDSIEPDGKRIWVNLSPTRLHADNNTTFVSNPVVFLHDELTPIWPHLESGDMVTTKIEHDFDGATIPTGTDARVSKLILSDDGSQVLAAELMFADGHYSSFQRKHIQKG